MVVGYGDMLLVLSGLAARRGAPSVGKIFALVTVEARSVVIVMRVAHISRVGVR